MQQSNSVREDPSVQPCHFVFPFNCRYFKQQDQKKGTRAIGDYNYKLHASSSFCMLPGGEHKFTIESKSIKAALKETGVLEQDENEESYVKPAAPKLMRQQSIEYSDTKARRQKAKQAGAALIKERADDCANKKIRHSFEEKAFFFPLPCATITFPIETKSTGALTWITFNSSRVFKIIHHSKVGTRLLLY